VKQHLHPGLVAIGGRDWMGGANYVRNLAAAVHAAAPETPLTWICGAGLSAEWREVSPRVEVPAPTRWNRWLGTSRSRAGFRRCLEEAGIDFVYPLTYDNFYNLGLRFPLGAALQGKAWAGWIPDFQHRYLPHLFSEQELRWRDAQMALLAEEAPRVVLSSRSALADFQRFFPAHASKATLLAFRVAPTALPDGPQGRGCNTGHAAHEESTPARFFLVCNQFWKHKNHQVVFEALRILASRGVKPLVLCTGALEDYRGDEYVRSLRALLAEPELSEQVQLLGLVSRERLVALMRRALAVIQPSLFEGWSTVVEDARALGRPCLLSDLPVHREQDPPGARFFPAESAEGLAGLLAEVWEHGTPGPDLEAEAIARETARVQQLAFGREFLDLASSLVNQRS
jgi:glycosyltransferase involved in cell wall biosynthesis